MYREKAVCEREGVPFLNKADMAVAQTQCFEPAADTHVIIDNWYHCQRVCHKSFLSIQLIAKDMR